jgi:hypothetical protein
MWQMNVLRQGLVGNLFASLWANVVAVEYDGSSNASTMVLQMLEQIDFRPVILAGGSGTRFWPRSRRAHAKQVLALDGERSMIQQTVERLKPLAGLEKTWCRAFPPRKLCRSR